jgi:hypothetical protein
VKNSRVNIFETQTNGTAVSTDLADSTTSAASPVIKTICPAEAWCQGGSTAVLIGENFHDGLQVCFGTTSVWGEVRIYGQYLLLINS